MMTRRSIIPLMFFAILMSACAPTLMSTGYEESPAEAAYAVEEVVVEREVVADEGGSYISDSTVNESFERVVIKNASIGIVVSDPAKAMDSIGRSAEEKGGFIVSSNLYKIQTAQGLDVPEATITIRVPAGLLISTLDEIKTLVDDPEEDIQYENVSGQDVTREYTDLKSRLRNLESAEEKLNEILEEAYKTEDVLSVYNELTRVTEQIEIIKGQIQYYDEASSLSAIDVNIVAHESMQELTIGGWEPVGVARNAIQALIDTLQFLVDATIWIVILIIPVGLCILIPLWLIFLGVRALWRRRKLKKQAEALDEEPETVPEADQTNAESE
jgi:hypothetical protein